jgi:hypothetical protein
MRMVAVKVGTSKDDTVKVTSEFNKWNESQENEYDTTLNGTKNSTVVS